MQKLREQAWESKREGICQRIAYSLCHSEGSGFLIYCDYHESAGGAVLQHRSAVTARLSDRGQAELLFDLCTSFPTRPPAAMPAQLA